MKFLISNYSTPWNTEPFYFNAALSIVGVQAKMFDPKDSIYDVFDSFSPDVVITHIGHISKSMLHYVTNNNNILLLINTNEVPTDYIENLASSLYNNNIRSIFFGERDIQLTNGRYVKIMQSADIFLNSGTKTYNVNKLIFVNDSKDIVELDGSYHYTSIIPSLSNEVDFILPLNILSTLFPNYNEIIFKDSSYIGSQISFNAIYSGTKIIFETDDTDKINTIFKGNKFLSSVKNKHTCLHRLKSLLSQIECKDIIDKLEREIAKL